MGVTEDTAHLLTIREEIPQIGVALHERRLSVGQSPFIRPIFNFDANRPMIADVAEH